MAARALSPDAVSAALAEPELFAYTNLVLGQLPAINLALGQPKQSLLAALKEAGVAKMGHRQKVAKLLCVSCKFAFCSMACFCALHACN